MITPSKTHGPAHAHPPRPLLQALLVTLAASIAPLAFACTLPFGGGNGSEATPYLISTPEHLEALRDAINVSATCITGGFHYRQTADIDLTGRTTWTRGIGANQAVPNRRFLGVYDGGGYAITALAITKSSFNTGLFEGAGAATIDDLVLEDAVISGTATVGALVAATAGTTIRNVTVTNLTLTATQNNVGGLVGYAVGGAIAHTSVEGSVSIQASTHRYAGGLLGYAENVSIADSSTDVALSVTGPFTHAGGLVGYFDNDDEAVRSIARSHATGSLSITTTEYTARFGGLIGATTGANLTLDTVYATGDVTSGVYVGGLVGDVADGITIRDSYATGNVTAVNPDASTDDYLGGLVGYLADYAILLDVYATGDVTGNDRVGGLIGRLSLSTDIDGFASRLADVSASGDVSGSDYVGGLIGYLDISDDGVQITDASASGEVVSSGTDGTGGFIGRIATTDVIATITRATASGPVTGPGNVGGLIGYADGIGEGLLKVIDSHYEGAEAVVTVLDDGDVGGGLIGTVDQAEITDSTADAPVNGFADIGGLIGEAEDVIVTNSHATGAVVSEDEDDVGGLIGTAEDVTIDASSATGNVSGGDRVGGLVGETEDVTISDSFATGDVSGEARSGGLVGYTYGDTDILRSWASGDVTTTKDSAGGLVGAFWGSRSTVSASYATGSVTGRSDVGGLLGVVSNDHPFANVKTSYATGGVLGQDNVGGLIGRFREGAVTNVFASGSVATTGVAPNANVGALIGNVATTEFTTIQAYLAYSLAVGAVQPAAGATGVGGAIGVVGGPRLSVSNDTNFWDTESTGQSASARGTPLTTELARTFATFADAGWEIVAEAEPDAFQDDVESGDPVVIWVLCDDGVADAYPVLAFQETRAACGPNLLATLSLPGGRDLLRGEPFAVTIAFTDPDGNEIAMPERSRVTLTASGGHPDDVLRTLGNPYAAPSERILAGLTSVTISDLTYSGVSLDPNGRDILITVGSDEGFFPDASITVTVREGVLTLTPASAALPADGEAITTIAATLRNDRGTTVRDASLRFETTAGAFVDAAGLPLGQVVDLVTDASGRATARLRASDVPSIATVTAACRGVCVATTTIEFLDPRGERPSAIADVALTAGDRQLTAAFTLPANTPIGDVEFRVWPEEGMAPDAWTSAGGTMSPIVITGLTNGIPYAVQLRAIAVDATAEAGEPSAIVVGTPNWTALTVDAGAPTLTLPADGVTEAALEARLLAADGTPAAGVTLDVTATRPIVIDGDELVNEATFVTNADGSVPVRFRALTEPGIVTITLACRDASCAAVITLELTSTLATPPANLEAIAGNQKIWLLFDPAVGDVVGYQYRIDEGAWIDLPEDAVAPYLIAEIPNGVTIAVAVRAVTSDGTTAATDAVQVTAREIGEPEADIGADQPDAPLALPVVNGRATLTIPYLFTNEGTEPLTTAWLSQFGLAPGQRLVAIEPDVGTVTRYGDRWYWRGFTLAPGASIPGTLTIEIDAP